MSTLCLDTSFWSIPLVLRCLEQGRDCSLDHRFVSSRPNLTPGTWIAQELHKATCSRSYLNWFFFRSQNDVFVLHSHGVTDLHCDYSHFCRPQVPPKRRIHWIPPLWGSWLLRVHKIIHVGPYKVTGNFTRSCGKCQYQGSTIPPAVYASCVCSGCLLSGINVASHCVLMTNTNVTVPQCSENGSWFSGTLPPQPQVLSVSQSPKKLLLEPLMIYKTNSDMNTTRV